MRLKDCRICGRGWSRRREVCYNDAVRRKRDDNKEIREERQESNPWGNKDRNPTKETTLKLN